jgi:spore germination cell wall hydrolase CwlJ-like protein
MKFVEKFRKDIIYCIIILLSVAMLTTALTNSRNNFYDMVEVNEELHSLIDTEYVSHINTYRSMYHESQSKYKDLLDEYESMQQTELPIYKYTEDEIYFLAQCVEAEAGYYANHDRSQRYVTQVILNRVKSGLFPNTIREVITQIENGVVQFSVAYNGMMNREVQPETLANVYSVLLYGTDLPEYVHYFYSSSLTECWVNTLNTYDTIQGTVFAYE